MRTTSSTPNQTLFSQNKFFWHLPFSGGCPVSGWPWGQAPTPFLGQFCIFQAWGRHPRHRSLPIPALPRIPRNSQGRSSRCFQGQAAGRGLPSSESVPKNATKRAAILVLVEFSCFILFFVFPRWRLGEEIGAAEPSSTERGLTLV